MVYLLQGFTLGFSAGVSPGPMHAYLSSQTLKNGWRRAIPAIFAPLISDGPIIALVLLVLTQMPEAALRVLHILGGLFILTLARAAYRDFRAAAHDLTPEPGTARRSLIMKQGFFSQPMNFNFVWGGAGGPLLLEGWNRAAAGGVGFLVAFYVALIGTFALFVGIFASARHLGPRISRALSGLSAVALAAFGLYQLYAGVM